MPNPVIIILYGTKHWFNGSKLHREDGPAVIYKDGNQEWYLNGKEYTEDAYITIQFFNGVNVNA